MDDALRKPGQLADGEICDPLSTPATDQAGGRRRVHELEGEVGLREALIDEFKDKVRRDHQEISELRSLADALKQKLIAADDRYLETCKSHQVAMAGLNVQLDAVTAGWEGALILAERQIVLMNEKDRLRRDLESALEQARKERFEARGLWLTDLGLARVRFFGLLSARMHQRHLIARGLIESKECANGDCGHFRHQVRKPAR